MPLGRPAFALSLSLFRPLSLALSSLFLSAPVTSGRVVTHLVARERREEDRGPPREEDARLSSSSRATVIA